MKPKNLVYTAILMTCMLVLFNVCQNYNSSDSHIQESEYFKSIPISNKFIGTVEGKYWIDAGDYTQDGKPDIIVYGLDGYNKTTNNTVLSPIYLYKNPGVSLNGHMDFWKRQLIGKILAPVSMAHADINGDGKLDIILNNEYSRNIFNRDTQRGNVFWLENPGDYDDDTINWVRHDIGKTTVKRGIAVGRFTQHNKDEIVTVPLVGKFTNNNTERDTLVYNPIKIYEEPENVQQSGGWSETIINNEFSLIHDYTIKKNPKLSEYDVLLISSLEGTSYLYFGRDKQWHIERISTGQTNMSDYAKSNDNRNKKALHKLGKPNKSGFSAGQYVITNDFDQDGTDGFLTIFPQSHKGILYSEPISTSKFGHDTTRISTQTTGRIAIADFDEDGWDDFVTTGYIVRDHYEDEGSRLYIHLNKIGMKKFAKSLNQ